MNKIIIVLLLLVGKMSFSQKIVYYDYFGDKLKDKGGAYYYSVDSMFPEIIYTV